jgi:hypothetical protein
MAIKYFIKSVVSEYEKDGVIKKSYANIGTIFESKNGLMMALEVLPLFSLKEGKMLAFLNTPEEVENYKNARKTQGNSSNQLQDDTIPF